MLNRRLFPASRFYFEQRFPAVGRFTCANIFLPIALADSTVHRDSIVVDELFACADGTESVDEYPATFVIFDGLAIGRARMIDPTGAISSRCSVDDGAVAQSEQEGMVRIIPVANRLPIGGAFGKSLAAILDDFGVFANGSRRKHSAAVNRRISDAVTRGFGHRLVQGLTQLFDGARSPTPDFCESRAAATLFSDTL